MGKNCAQVISDFTRWHLTKNNGILFGQSIKAVGWVGNSVPDCEGIVELPNTDVAGTSIACGAALIGRRPILVIRYQGFMWLNSNSIVSCASRSEFLWQRPSPMLIRAIGMEVGGICTSSAGSFHHLFMSVPGIVVFAPMTPKDYTEITKYFLEHNEPIYLSESRQAFSNSEEMSDIFDPRAQCTLMAISTARIHAMDAIKKLNEKGIFCNLIHQTWLSPFNISEKKLAQIKKSRFSIVIDNGPEICGTSRNLAYELNLKTGVHTFALGLKNHPAAVSGIYKNQTPSTEEICNYVLDKLNYF